MGTKGKNIDYVGEVIRRYFRERYASSVEADVQRWLIDPEHADRKFRSLETEWELVDSGKPASAQRAFNAVQAKIDGVKTRPVFDFRRTALRVAAVVVPILVVFACMWAYMDRNAAGKKTAWIGFDVPYGQTARLDLPDGSQMIINPGSNVSFPEEFGERCVNISGEAFFDVAPDSQNPFVVTTENLTVRVLGTSFNVQAISEIGREVVSVSGGRVQVSTARGESRDLHAGDLLTLDKQQGNITIGRFDPSEMAHKNGGVYFNDNTCNEIFSMLNRYYNVPFHYAGKCKNGQRYTLKFNNDESIEQIMNVLGKLIEGFTYEVRNDGIHIVYR